MTFADKIFFLCCFLVCIAVLLFSSYRYMMIMDNNYKKSKMLMYLSLVAMGCLLIAESIALRNDISVIGSLRNILSQGFTSKEIIFIIVAALALFVLDGIIKKVKGSKVNINSMK